jgi:hypothetical protein
MLTEHHKGLYIHYSKRSNWCPSCCSHMWMRRRKLERTHVGMSLRTWYGYCLEVQQYFAAGYCTPRLKVIPQDKVQWCEFWRTVPSTDTTLCTGRTKILMLTIKLSPEPMCGVASMAMLLWGLSSWITGWEAAVTDTSWRPRRKLTSTQWPSCPLFDFTSSSSTVRQRLDLSAWWIGSRETVEWPSRSPDFTPLDLFQWNQLKSVVNYNRPGIIAGLQCNIRAARTAINSPTLRHVCCSVRRRIHVCERQDGHQF